MSQSLSRALIILGELSEGPKSLEDLASRLDVHKSTVMRLLRTMEPERVVRRDPGQRYVLGSRLFELANRALEHRDVRTVARPHLSTLNASTGQTVHLATYESGEAIYIDKFDAIQSVRMYSRVGRPAPLHCTAVGKVLVSGRPRSEWRQIAERIDYVKFTERSIDYAGGISRGAGTGCDPGFRGGSRGTRELCQLHRCPRARRHRCRGGRGVDVRARPAAVPRAGAGRSAAGARGGRRHFRRARLVPGRLDHKKGST